MEFQIKKRSNDPDFNAIAKLSSSVGHELGNILLKVMGRADLALVEGDTNRVRDHLGSIIQACERASLLVRNLQIFAQGNVEPTHVHLETVIARISKLLETDLIRHKVTLTEKIEKGVADIWGDERLIELALANVILNAIQASPTDSEVTIQVKKSTLNGKLAALIEVTDVGPGIDDAHKDQVWAWGFTTKASRGLGLGLPVAQTILESSKSTIELAPNGAGKKGTRATVLIPCAD